MSLSSHKNLSIYQISHRITKDSLPVYLWSKVEVLSNHLRNQIVLSRPRLPNQNVRNLSRRRLPNLQFEVENFPSAPVCTTSYSRLHVSPTL